MKKIFDKKIIITIIICGIVFTSIGICATNTYKASDILYTKNDGTATNVNAMINELNNICREYTVQLQYRIENKTYEIGESVNWAGQNWYAINNDSNSVTLILKNNYATGAYGSSTTFEGSTAYNKVNVDFINNNGQIIEAINSGAVVQQGTYNNEPYYVRLPENLELTNLIPNGSGTAFWTKTVNGEGLYFGNSTGENGVNYASSRIHSGYASAAVYGQSCDYIKVSYCVGLSSNSLLSPTVTSVTDGYTTAVKYASPSCSRFYGTRWNYCDPTNGVSSAGSRDGSDWEMFPASADGCTAYTVYTLSSAESIGYRPVVTVYKK